MPAVGWRKQGALTLLTDKELGHGPRLNDEEYDRRIVALQSALPPVPSRRQRIDVRRAELDLAINHRLGRNFPAERREALWAIQNRVESKRVRLLMKHLVRRLFTRSLVRDAQGLAGYLVDEYAKVLSTNELESFFGPEEVHSPGLPVPGNEQGQ